MRAGRAAWVGALALALAFLALDSAARVRTIRNVTDIQLGIAQPPAADASSPSGYAARQHHLILPAQGTDGYHWLMQTEQMLADGSPRIRRIDYDGPGGRPVHWSGPIRWWTAGVAAAYRVFHPELSLPHALERVAPWAGTLLLAGFVLLMTPLTAHRFGPAAAALVAVGSVSIHPFYQYSVAGFLDHHGAAAMCALAAVMLLLCGSSGRVRMAPANPSDAASASGSRAAARTHAWFVAAAAAGAAGLWISAATMVPVLIGCGIGALAAGLLPAPAAGTWRIEPRLWRTWGAAGAAFSVLFYLIEYFPAHLGMRLEVNHPLYALAWLGGGDLICRLCDPAQRSRMWMAADVLLIALLPITVLIGGAAVFTVSDPFLWALHRDNILEFRSMFSESNGLNAFHLVQGTVGVVPLLALPLAALLWPSDVTGRSRSVLRAALCVPAAAGVLFAHALLLPVARAVTDSAVLSHVITAACDVAVFALLFLLPLRRGMPRVSAHVQSLLLLASAPALLLLFMTLRQVRWLGVDSALWLTVLALLAGVLAKDAAAWSRRRRTLAKVFLAIALLPFPLFTALFPWQFGYPAVIDATQLVARDVSYMLRARLGSETGTILSGPTSTTWMEYFGGMNGTASLYWENIHGLRAAEAINDAQSDDAALALVREHDITHVVIYSWEPTNGAFVQRLMRGDAPPWLRRIPYVMPDVSVLRSSEVYIYEVVRG